MINLLIVMVNYVLNAPDMSVIGSNTGMLHTYDVRSPAKWMAQWQAHSGRISSLGIHSSQSMQLNNNNHVVHTMHRPSL